MHRSVSRVVSSSPTSASAVIMIIVILRTSIASSSSSSTSTTITSVQSIGNGLSPPPGVWCRHVALTHNVRRLPVRQIHRSHRIPAPKLSRRDATAVRAHIIIVITSSGCPRWSTTSSPMHHSSTTSASRSSRSTSFSISMIVVVSFSLGTRDFHGQITPLQLHCPCSYDTIHRRFITCICTRNARGSFNRFLRRASLCEMHERVPFCHVASRQLDRFDFTKLTENFSQLPFQILLVQGHPFGWYLSDIHGFTLRQQIFFAQRLLFTHVRPLRDNRFIRVAVEHSRRLIVYVLHCSFRALLIKIIHKPVPFVSTSNPIRPGPACSRQRHGLNAAAADFQKLCHDIFSRSERWEPGHKQNVFRRFNRRSDLLLFVVVLRVEHYRVRAVVFAEKLKRSFAFPSVCKSRKRVPSIPHGIVWILHHLDFHRLRRALATLPSSFRPASSFKQHFHVSLAG
mmetsp:Transcript_9425/g.27204  ORF Transcript_9425/g.27204 Transcript_9425/m.27204 type:complete len:455 (+) Transcript_9425:100-1464(+)